MTLDDRSVATFAHIRNERRGPVTYALTPGGGGVRSTMSWTASTDSFAKVSPRLTGEIQLNIRGLAIGALRGGRREWIPPEILDVLHMLRIVFQLTNQPVVVLVSIVAEGLLTLQDDHRHTVGIGFLEDLTHALHRLERRRICADSAIPNALSRPAPAGERR